MCLKVKLVTKTSCNRTGYVVSKCGETSLHDAHVSHKTLQLPQTLCNNRAFIKRLCMYCFNTCSRLHHISHFFAYININPRFLFSLNPSPLFWIALELKNSFPSDCSYSHVKTIRKHFSQGHFKDGSRGTSYVTPSCVPANPLSTDSDPKRVVTSPQ